MTDLYYPDLDPCGPIMRLFPDAREQGWGIWWHLTPSFVATFLSVLGFTKQTSPTTSSASDTTR